ncbi:hypothetical protein PGTUg99_003462, partial [Puccinia graminis f. sp. tritici]
MAQVLLIERWNQSNLNEYKHWQTHERQLYWSKTKYTGNILREFIKGLEHHFLERGAKIENVPQAFRFDPLDAPFQSVSTLSRTALSCWN